MHVAKNALSELFVRALLKSDYRSYEIIEIGGSFYEIFLRYVVCSDTFEETVAHGCRDLH
jgi:hypothetical protein